MKYPIIYLSIVSLTVMELLAVPPPPDFRRPPPPFGLQPPGRSSSVTGDVLLDMPPVYTPYTLEVDARFPEPLLPKDNPLIEERIELGQKLFFDPVLSVNGKVSCATCHIETFAFSDPERFSQGVGRMPTRRHSMPLFNLAWKDRFFWDGRVSTLREQVLHPIQHPNEMGEELDNVTQRLREMPEYVEAFSRAFGTHSLSSRNLSLALEAYLLTLTSLDSPYDQAMRGEATLSPLAQRGMELFMTPFNPARGKEGAACFQCHQDPLFTDNRFHNNGLGDRADRGMAEVTRHRGDHGKFSTPSLRNVAVTAPYMHDGRFETLREAVEHYSTGIVDEPNLDRHLARLPSGGLQLSEEDIDALVAFLGALTDPRYDPARFASSGN